MSFHLGKPILVMLLMALLSGGFIATRPAPPQADLVLWTFTFVHAESYRSIIADFEKQTGLKVSIQSLSSRAENVRLESMFMSGQQGRILPDVVEIEIGQVGRFFRPPVEEIGLEPLNDYLARDGWDKRILQSRFAPWSKGDVVLGVPHDVHPVSIAYREDLFREAGIDLSLAKTWPQFQDMCLAFQDYWRARGYPNRHAIELPRAAADNVVVMLLQRGVNLIDGNNVIHINDPVVTKTVAFYAQLVAGNRKIASETAGGNSGLWTVDATAGNLCAFITPDWRMYQFKSFAPQLSGKLRMMPLPKFDPTDAPTATWGGTMIGITRNSRNREAAWKLIEFLYLSERGLEARHQVNNILPPVIEWWDRDAYHQPDPFFGGQKTEQLYVELARQIPRRYVTPVTPIAQAYLSYAVNRAAKHVQSSGTDGLESRVQQWLDFAAVDLKARIEHGRFEE